MAARFSQKQYYGEVNSFLRHVLLDLPVAKRGVIIRDPRNILISTLNRGVPSNSAARALLDSFALGYRALDQALQDKNVILIRFEKMTTDVVYMRDLLKVFGIADVPVSKAMIAQKIHFTKVYEFKTYTSIPTPLRCYHEAQTEWYREKYYTKS